MSSWAKKGVKCVCVDAEFSLGDSPLTSGNVYMIYGVVGRQMADVGIYKDSSLNILISGVRNPFRPDGSFAVERFKPLIAKTQSEDIEMFLRIASKAPSNMETTDA